MENDYLLKMVIAFFISIVPAYWASIVAHEYGHALIGRCCGLGIQKVDISLTQAACYFVQDHRCDELEYRPWARLFIASAGAVANILVIIGSLLLFALEVEVGHVLGVFILMCVGFNCLAVLMVLLPSDDPQQDASRCREALRDIWSGVPPQASV